MSYKSTYSKCGLLIRVGRACYLEGSWLFISTEAFATRIYYVYFLVTNKGLFWQSTVIHAFSSRPLEAEAGEFFESEFQARQTHTVGSYLKNKYIRTSDGLFNKRIELVIYSVLNNLKMGQTLFISF